MVSGKIRIKTAKNRAIRENRSDVAPNFALLRKDACEHLSRKKDHM